MLSFIFVIPVIVFILLMVLISARIVNKRSNRKMLDELLTTGKITQEEYEIKLRQGKKSTKEK